MENENAIIKLTEELVNAQDNVTELRAIKSELTFDYRKIKRDLERLISAILDNSRLDYKEEDLDLKNDTPILQLVKFLDPDSYEDRLNDLKREAQEIKQKDKPVKEARKDGK